MQIKDLVGLSEPACKLIDAFTKATATLYEPRRIRNEARAKADAVLIATKAEIDADELRRRAIDRFVTELLQKEENLQAILGRTTELLTGPAPVAEMDSDWIRRFATEAQDVSDESLHEFWARLLAGEFQAPGTYPRRLLRLLKDLDPKDASLIEAIAPQVLLVENHDGATFGFLFSRIVERWTLGPDGEENEMASLDRPETALLRELGLVEPDSFLFEISVEGYLQPDKIHLSRYSARRIFTRTENLVPQNIQPNFLRTKGPPVSRDGRPQINISTKSIAFHGWKVTQLGESMLSLIAKAPEPAQIASVREHLVGAGLVLAEK